METMEQKRECATETEHNGCVGHPITNLLMTTEHPALAAVAGDPLLVELLQAHTDATATTAPGDDEMPPEMMAEMEAVFDELQGKVTLALGQVSATDERTAHLVINVERLSRGLDDAHAKLDRILNHFKVA